jgi:hypothetical protein
MLAYLKFLWRSGMFVLLLFVFFSAYLAFTGSKTSWVQDYAAKNVSTVYRNEKKATFFTNEILKGVYITKFNQIRDDLLKIESFEKKLDDYLQRKAEKEVRGSNIEIDSARFMISYEVLGDFNGHTRVCDYLIGLNCCDYEESQKFIITVNRGKYMDIGCIQDLLHTLLSVDDHFREILKSFFSLDKDLQQIILNTFDKATTFEKPWSYRKLFFADPKIALANLGMPASIFATFIGFFVWRAPLSWLRFPCKILRWPTPDDFNNSCQARNAWVERVFSETLFEMGINKTDILELSMGQSQS